MTPRPDPRNLDSPPGGPLVYNYDNLSMETETMSDYARYQMSDGTVVDIGNASRQWEEATQWDGSNHISLATGSQWDHERLYRSRKGRYYIERCSAWQGTIPSAEWISNEAACRWLLTNEYDLDADNWPKDLATLVDTVME